MNKETRGLYIALILFSLAFSGFCVYLGIVWGELRKMEEFKDTFMPNPKNVFPDAVEVE